MLQLFLMLIVKQSPWTKFQITSLQNWPICVNADKMGLLNYMIIEYVKLLENWMTLQKSITMFYISKLKWNSFSLDSKIFYSFLLYSSISINSDRYNLHAFPSKAKTFNYLNTLEHQFYSFELKTVVFSRFWSDCAGVRSKGRKSDERCLTLLYTVSCTLNSW